MEKAGLGRVGRRALTACATPCRTSSRVLPLVYGTLRALRLLVVISPPVVEAPAPGILSVRYEWPEHLEPEWQRPLVEAAGVESAQGPVALLFSLAPRICALAPTVRVFWRTVVCDPRLRITAIAVVTASWAVEVEARGFGVTNALSGRPLRVRTFRHEPAATAWLARVVQRARPPSQVERAPEPSGRDSSLKPGGETPTRQFVSGPLEEPAGPCEGAQEPERYRLALGRHEGDPPPGAP